MVCSNVPRVTAAEVLRERVKQLLDERGLNQSQLAQGVGRGKSWSSGLLKKHGGTTLATVDLIADFFQVPRISLFDESALTLADTGRSPTVASSSQEAMKAMFSDPFVMKVAALAFDAKARGLEHQLRAALAAFERATEGDGGAAHPAPRRGQSRR